MHADISALHGLAASHARHADDLQDVSSRLSAAPPQPEAFGPAGARFLAALRDAVDRDVGAASALADRLRDASGSAAATATSYDDADVRVGRRVGSTGV